MRREQALGQKDVLVSESLGEEAALCAGLEIQQLKKLMCGSRVVAMRSENVQMEKEDAKENMATAMASCGTHSSFCLSLLFKNRLYLQLSLELYRSLKTLSVAGLQVDSYMALPGRVPYANVRFGRH